MQRSSLRLLTLIPTAENLRQALAKFSQSGYGRVLGFDDELTRLAQNYKPSDSEIEVTSLQEFAGTCLTLAGVRRLPPASDLQMAEAVRYALSKCDENSFLSATARFPGTQRRVGRVLKEFRDASLDSAGIRDLASKVSISLGQKLLCLAEIEATVEEVLAELAVETPQARLRACLEISWPDEVVSPRVMIILGSQMNPLVKRWIEWTLGQGINTTLLAFDHPLAASFETAKSLASSFELAPERIGNVPEPCASLFSDSIAQSLGIEVAIESCFEPFAECEWVLRRVREDIDRGIVPSQIGIFVRDVEGYARLLEAAARRLDVEISQMRVASAASNRCVRWLVRLLKSLGQDKPTAFLRALNETYSNLTPEERSAARSTLRDSLRFSNRSWEVFSDGIAPLEGSFWIQEAISMRPEGSGQRPRRQWTEFLDQVLEFKPLFDMRDSGAELDKRDAAAIRNLQEGFRQRMEVSPNEELDFDAFIEDLVQIAGSIPEIHEHQPMAVRTSSSPNALVGCESLYVLGLLEGVFPRRRSEDPILTDSERTEIMEVLGERAITDSRTVARSERDLFLQLCAAPTRKLTLMYPTSSEERDNVPAFYLAEIERACGSAIRRVHHARGEWAPKVPLANMAESDIALAAILASPLPPADFDLASEQVVLDLIRTSEETAFSPRDLRDALLCRFRFTCRNRLKLRARTATDPEAAAQRASQSVQADAASIEELREALERSFAVELDLLLGVVDERDLALIKAAGQRLFANLVASERRSREIWAKDAGSVVAPAWFDGTAIADVLKLDDTSTLKLAGRVESVGTRGRKKVATVRGVGADLAKYSAAEASDADKLLAGLYLAALKSAEAAVEFVGTEGDRTFLVLERDSATPPGDAKAGLRVVSVDNRETGFFRDVKRLAKEALERARTNRFEADPGSHCLYCEYRDLCRRAADAYSESSGVPQ